jgi:hypothetical protein
MIQWSSKGPGAIEAAEQAAIESGKGLREDL